MLGLDTSYLYTKFNNFSLGHSRDVVGANQNFNGLRDWSRPFQGCFVIRGLGVPTMKLDTKIGVSISTNYKDMEGKTKCRRSGGLG